MIRVLVDSSADYRMEELIEKNILLVPLGITVNDTDTYRDEVDLKRDDLFKMMIEGNCTVKTSQPSPQAFADVFQKVKDAGDEVICILLSSALSGTCQSALLAKEMVDYDKIHIVDSLTATVAIQILAEHALAMIKENHSAEEIVESLEELKGRLKVIAGVDTLKYLYLGGRVSRTTAIVADTVSIKPGIFISKEGTVGVGSKYLGVSRAVRDLAKQIKNTKIDTSHPTYLIYSYDETNAMKLDKALESAGIHADKTCMLGASLGVHIGPGAFGVICATK